MRVTVDRYFDRFGELLGGGSVVHSLSIGYFKPIGRPIHPHRSHSPQPKASAAQSKLDGTEYSFYTWQTSLVKPA
jgi:hypothetical protein